MKAVDAHTHVFPDDLAPRAVAELEAGCPWRAVGDGTTAGLIEAMDRDAIARAVVCTVATKPAQAANILEFCRRVRSDRLEPLASVHPDTPEAAACVERIARAGLAGIKVHPMYQACPLDDPRMDVIYSAAAAGNLLVTAHCGRDIAFDDDDDRASPERLARVIERHRGLRLVATHLGGWRRWDQVERHLVGAGIHFECSFALDYLSAGAAVRLIRLLGIDRVMFGSDWPWTDPAAQLARLHALDLAPDELERIVGANAQALLPPPGA